MTPQQLTQLAAAKGWIHFPPPQPANAQPLVMGQAWFVPNPNGHRQKRRRGGRRGN